MHIEEICRIFWVVTYNPLTEKKVPVKRFKTLKGAREFIGRCLV